MSNRLTSVLVWVLFCLAMPRAYAQEIRDLRIGDKVPDLVFHNVLNYKQKSAKLSDFAGKVVILDMWSTFCGPCISAFPTMDSLQKRFGDQLQILLVNPYDNDFDNPVQVKKVLARNRSLTGFYPSLPIPVGDTLLNQYFPHSSVPHEVWIGKDRRVIAITEASAVNDRHISALLSKGSIDLPLKNDQGFDRGIPLLVGGNGGTSADFLFRSLFTKYKPGIGAAIQERRDSNKHIIGYCILNYDMRYLVRMAYPVLTDFTDSRVVLDLRQPEMMGKVYDTSFVFSYDLVIPPATPAVFDASRYLREDLKRYFNLSVCTEVRAKKCWVIRAPDPSRIAVSDQPKGINIDKSTLQKFIHRYPVALVLQMLDHYQLPIVDETELSALLIDIDFPEHFDLSDAQAVIGLLRKAGFEISEEERFINVAVVTDRSK